MPEKHWELLKHEPLYVETMELMEDWVKNVVEYRVDDCDEDWVEVLSWI